MLSDESVTSLLSFDASSLPAWPENLSRPEVPETLVKLNAGKVQYGQTVIFENLDLEIKQGDHTLLTGANGSGKSTLLDLLTGDHPQCYGNDLEVLGLLGAQVKVSGTSRNRSALFRRGCTATTVFPDLRCILR